MHSSPVVDSHSLCKTCGLANFASNWFGPVILPPDGSHTPEQPNPARAGSSSPNAFARTMPGIPAKATTTQEGRLIDHSLFARIRPTPPKLLDFERVVTLV